MNNTDLDILKQKMKEYRDIFGNQLNRIDLIDDAKNIIDLETILNYHHDFIDDMASDAHSSLSKFKQNNNF